MATYIGLIDPDTLAIPDSEELRDLFSLFDIDFEFLSTFCGEAYLAHDEAVPNMHGRQIMAVQPRILEICCGGEQR